MLRKLLLYLFVFFVFPAGCFIVQAQADQVSGDIQFELSPKYPGPNEQVRIQAVSHSFDKNTAPYTWYVNGKQVEKGTAKTEISITTGAVGTSLVVRVVATPPGIRTYDNSITIRPSTLDLIWDTNSYTPTEYRGKALPAQNSIVTAIAMPSFVTSSGKRQASSLIYDWWVNNKLLKERSGRGKNTLHVRMASNSNTQHTIRVRVSDDKNEVTQQKQVAIQIHDPLLLFYELHPLNGPQYQSAIANSFRVAPGEQKSFLAIPYFASAPQNALTYAWRVNNEKIPPSADDKTPYILNYFTEEGSSAQQSVSLEITNPFYMLEFIKKSFRVYAE